jgi:hypothetical protein
VTPTETLPGPKLDSWRNRLAHRIANFALNRIASAEYRDIIDGAIVLGMSKAAEDAIAERVGGHFELVTPHVDPPDVDGSGGPFGI